MGFHLRGAATVNLAVGDFAGERIEAPAPDIAGGDDVSMTGEDEMRRSPNLSWRRDYRRRRAGFVEDLSVACEALGFSAPSSTSSAPASNGVTDGRRMSACVSATAAESVMSGGLGKSRRSRNFTSAKRFRGACHFNSFAAFKPSSHVVQPATPKNSASAAPNRPGRRQIGVLRAQDRHEPQRAGEKGDERNEAREPQRIGPTRAREIAWTKGSCN